VKGGLKERPMPNYTYEQIGARAKARNPDRLGTFSDTDIGKRMADRNPKIASLVTQQAKPTPAPSIGLGEKALRTTSDVAVGAGKGILSTLAGASSLGEKIISAPFKALGGKTEKPLGQEIQESGKLDPTNLAQKVGFGAEQVAEFFIPGGAVSKASRATQAALKLSKAEKAVGAGAKGIELLKGAGRLGVRGGLEAGVVGGQAAIQQGGINDEVRQMAKFGAVAPIAGKVLGGIGKGVGVALEKTAGKTINSLIKPLARNFSFGKNPGAGVSKEGIVANSWDDLITKLTEKRQELGNAIGTELKATKIPVYLKDVVKPLDEAIAKSSVAPEINKAIIKRLKGAKKDVTRLVGNGKTPITAEKAFEAKQKIADLTNFTDAISDNALNKSLMGIYGKIKDLINKASPNVKNLNERFANIKSAELAAIYRDKIVARSNVLPLASKVSGVLGGGAIAGVPGSIAGLLLSSSVEKAIGSVAFKTRVAKLLQTLSGSQFRSAAKNPAIRKVLERLFGSVDEAEKLVEKKGVLSSIGKK